MAIDPQKADELAGKFKSARKTGPEPLPAHLPCSHLKEAVVRKDLDYIQRCISKAVADGTLCANDLKGQGGPGIVLNQDFSNARHRALMDASTVGSTSSKPWALFNAWGLMAEMGMHEVAAREALNDPQGLGASTQAVQESLRLFNGSADKYQPRREWRHTESTNSLPEGVHRIGFHAKASCNWDGEKIEDSIEPLDPEDDSNIGNRLMRIRLGSFAYLEVGSGSYYDDENHHDYTNGQLFVSASQEKMTAFIQARPRLFDVEMFLFNARHDTPALLAQLEAGMPADVVTDHTHSPRRALSAACDGHNLDSIQALLQAGANPSRLPGEHQSPLSSLLDGSLAHDAFVEHQPRDQRDGFKPSQENDPQSAVTHNNPRSLGCLHELIAHGVNVDEIGNDYRQLTPLMMACKMGNVEVFSSLLKAGAQTEPVIGAQDIVAFAKERKADKILTFLDAHKASRMIDAVHAKKNTHQP
jgi:xanthine/CO dehydrogenase XdhC/CoxF family maturation factor